MLTTEDLTDIETTGQADPTRLLNMNQKEFLAFAVLHVENKDKANSAASAALPVPVVPWLGSCRGALCCAPGPGRSQESQKHQPGIPEGNQAVHCTFSF